MKKEIILTDKAPAPIGPYSQAVKAGGFLFISGQCGIDPKTGNVVPGCVVCQTKQVLENLKALLAEAKTDFSNVVKTTVFIKDMNDFAKVNEVYAQYFGENPPARSCVEVARLPKDVLVEIELIATL